MGLKLKLLALQVPLDPHLKSYPTSIMAFQQQLQMQMDAQSGSESDGMQGFGGLGGMDAEGAQKHGKTVGAGCGVLILAMGAFAIYFANKEAEGDCEFDLKNKLMAYGASLIAIGGCSILGACVPAAVACVPMAQSFCQIMMVMLTVFSLMSYYAAYNCGIELWWAAIAFGNPCLALFIKCCCAPTVAKTTTMCTAHATQQALAPAGVRLLGSGAGHLTQAAVISAHGSAVAV